MANSFGVQPSSTQPAIPPWIGANVRPCDCWNDPDRFTSEGSSHTWSHCGEIGWLSMNVCGSKYWGTSGLSHMDWQWLKYNLDPQTVKKMVLNVTWATEHHSYKCGRVGDRYSCRASGLYCLSLFSSSCYVRWRWCSVVVEAGGWDRGRAQEHGRPHSEFSQAADQVQPSRVDRPAAHPARARVLLRFRSLHRQEATVSIVWRRCSCIAVRAADVAKYWSCITPTCSCDVYLQTAHAFNKFISHFVPLCNEFKTEFFFVGVHSDP